jgi:hypothetical protein
MKKILFFLLIPICLASCSEGLPGDIYLSISDDGNLTYYWDDNDCIPYGLIYGYYYGPCTEGTYSFEYGVSSGYWYGTYSIYANLGTTGLFGGSNGEDNYFSLSCTLSGSTITGREGNIVRAKTIKKTETTIEREYYLPDYTIRVVEQKTNVPKKNHNYKNIAE